MKHIPRSLKSLGVISACLAVAIVGEGCSADVTADGPVTGGKPTSSSGGSTSGAPTAGHAGHAGSTVTGGTPATGGSTPLGGTAGTSQGGRSGGPSLGGSSGVGSGPTGGSGGTGSGGASGGSGSAGKAGSGGMSTGGATGDACAMTTPLTGGTVHSSSNAAGKAAGLAWTVWANGSGGSITTYDAPAFSAAWNNSGDFLARIGLQWDATKTYDQYGTLTAQFASKKTGTGGGYSYIGMYGWSVSPCVEWYIVDDSYNKMPVNPGSTTNKGTADIDGGTYTLYTRATTGTGGSKCSGVNNWMQFYSVRQTARTCGQISLTQHFAAWAAAGMALGKMDQAQILVEVGGGSGSIDFTVANVTSVQ